MSALGTLIRARRRELGLTQAQLSKKVGISVSYVCGIEKDDKRPGIDIAAALASALGLPAEEFFNATVKDAGKQPVDQDRAQQVGVELRDRIAIKAMEGMLAGHFSHYGHENYWAREAIAFEAYEMADAMLKARAA